jgi:hypothetical protein
MDLLKLLAASALLAQAACYEPRFTDCAVRCSTDDDCAPGQTCGTHGYCAGTELACTRGEPDAAGSNSPPADAALPDAPAKVQLRVRISQDGKVLVEEVGMCDSEGWPGGDCRFTVTAGVPLILRAIPHTGHVFERWTSTACAMAPATCMLTPIAPMTEVRARFEQTDDGGED